MSPQELLEATAARYASARTYRDEGEVLAEFDTARGRYAVNSKPFSTAFVRDGGFRWEFRHGHSVLPGEPNMRYTVWSADQQAFQSRWTLDGGRAHAFDEITRAMDGPRGISGGSATAIVPLLRPDMTFAYRTTALTDPVAVGRDEIDGVWCTVIDGLWRDARHTLWIDDTLAIRKIRMVQEIDPQELPPPPDERRGDRQRFTTTTIIHLRPAFDEEIPAEAFQPPDVDAGAPPACPQGNGG